MTDHTHCAYCGCGTNRKLHEYLEKMTEDNISLRTALGDVRTAIVLDNINNGVRTWKENQIEWINKALEAAK